MSFPFEDVERSISGLRLRLNLPADHRLQAEFNAGLHPNLLSYRKNRTETRPLRALERCLIGATSYLHQLSTYYDIFGAGRCVILVQLLGPAVADLQERNVKGSEARIGRLVQAVDSDEFESTAFELIVASRYSALSEIDRIEFIEEQSTRTPDILFVRSGETSFVECKKVIRVKDFSEVTRTAVRTLLNRLISFFRERGISFLAELTFNCDPKLVTDVSLVEACGAALTNGVPVVTSHFTISAKVLSKFAIDDPILYPSPHFSWVRYGHRIRSEWFGIVHNLEGKPTRRVDTPEHLRQGCSTWLDSVRWDAAIKWKIADKSIVERYRRLPFDLLFDGMKQINNRGLDSTVHLWLETDYAIGRRQKQLLDFHARLSSQPNYKVGWIVINETLLDISPKGAIDLTEHAHLIRGPNATGPEPLVSGVLATTPQDTGLDGEFGVGNQLPDIDAE
jgi:hypothetical protein